MMRFRQEKKKNFQDEEDDDDSVDYVTSYYIIYRDNTCACSAVQYSASRLHNVLYCTALYVPY